MPLTEMGATQRLERARNAAFVSQLACDRQAFLKVMLSFVISTQVRAELPGDEQGAATRQIPRFRTPAGKRLCVDALTKSQQTAVQPIRPQEIDQFQVERRTARNLAAPGVRRQDVFTLEVDFGEPLA